MANTIGALEVDEGEPARGRLILRKSLIAIVVLIALITAAAVYFIWFHVRIVDSPVPERLETSAQFPQQESVLVTSVGIPLQTIRRGLENDLPRTLFKINEDVAECIPRETVRVFKQNLFKTPRVSCRLVGEIRRGSIKLSGRGDTLTATVPINAEIQIRDIGDVIKRETATATAVMRLNAKMGVASDWRLRPDVRISYEWFVEPGVDVLGQRITFTRQADRELAKIVVRAEKSLEREIAKLNLRREVAQLWAEGFTTLSLNRENPPVWMRLSPNAVGTSGVRVSGRQVTADLMLRANLGVFVGDEPAKPEAAPLGSNVGVQRGSGFEITVPVLADYSQVEPVILRALGRLAERGIAKEELGRLEVEFSKVTLYATEGGRLAVGVEASVEPVGNITDRIWGRSQGTIWLTATPITEPDSEVVRIEGLEVFGNMDTSVGDFLVRVIGSDEVRTEIERALVEDFSKDYNDVIGKARAGIRSVRLGDFNLSFDVTKLSHGKIEPTADGLFMPVTAQGSVRTALNPR